MFALRRSTVLADARRGAIARRPSTTTLVGAGASVRVGLDEQRIVRAATGAIVGAIVVGIGAAWALDLTMTRTGNVTLAVAGLVGAVAGGVVGAST